MGELIELNQPQISAKLHPRKPKSEDMRPRKHLFPDEVERMEKAARKVGRHRTRDALMITMLYRHGLRVGELTRLTWSQLDFKSSTIHVKRLKRGTESTHPIRGAELRLLRKLHRKSDCIYIFASERGGPLTTRTVIDVVQRAGELAGIEFRVNPHALRHACGYYLASRGTDTRAIQQYLGHKNISSTALYTALAPGRFNDFWED